VATAIIRPTGLLDPVILVRPVASQVDDILEEVRLRIVAGERVLITTLTKKFAEELDLYFKEISIKSAYIHSEIQAMERVEILGDLRRGKYDVLIGINLLREGLDLPEVSLVAIFDADKEGFLRSKTSLIQIIGRAARHQKGTVIMYADRETISMKEAILETQNRREIQMEYNQKHGITPKSTVRHLADLNENLQEELEKNENFGQSGANLTQFGFDKVEEAENNFEMSFESRYSRKSKPNKARAVQVFDTFESQKNIQTEQILDKINQEKVEYFAGYPNTNQVKLEQEFIKKQKTKLEKEMKIAIEKYEFEKASALKDILETF
jgi:excinuclease UvrABC helicase subunit UvrB